MRRAIRELKEEGYSLFEIIGTLLGFMSFFIIYGVAGTIELTGQITGISIALVTLSVLYIGIFLLVKILKEV